MHAGLTAGFHKAAFQLTTTEPYCMHWDRKSPSRVCSECGYWRPSAISGSTHLLMTAVSGFCDLTHFAAVSSNASASVSHTQASHGALWVHCAVKDTNISYEVNCQSILPRPMNWCSKARAPRCKTFCRKISMNSGLNLLLKVLKRTTRLPSKRFCSTNCQIGGAGL